jgi:hypothetical protein
MDKIEFKNKNVRSWQRKGSLVEETTEKRCIEFCNKLVIKEKTDG